jgi:hypothetical protein
MRSTKLWHLQRSCFCIGHLVLLGSCVPETASAQYTRRQPYSFFDGVFSCSEQGTFLFHAQYFPFLLYTYRLLYSVSHLCNASTVQQQHLDCINVSICCCREPIRRINDAFTTALCSTASIQSRQPAIVLLLYYRTVF